MPKHSFYFATCYYPLYLTVRSNPTHTSTKFARERTIGSVMSTLLVGLSQRSTKITAVNTEDGSIIKTFTNCKVNYNQKEFDQLKVHVGRCLRLSAKDPNYDVKKMSFKVEGGEIDLNVKALEDLRNGTPLPLFFSSPSQCIHLIVSLSHMVFLFFFKHVNLTISSPRFMC